MDSIPFDSLEKSISDAAGQPFVSCVEKDRRTDKRYDVYVSLDFAVLNVEYLVVCVM